MSCYLIVYLIAGVITLVYCAINARHDLIDWREGYSSLGTAAAITVIGWPLILLGLITIAIAKYSDRLINKLDESKRNK